MHPSLDDAAFLARSASRVEVLVAVGEEPRTREELEAVTAGSRVTVDRTLDDLEERGWIAGSDGRYEGTPTGAFYASEIARLRSRIGEIEQNAGSATTASTESPLDVVAFLARSPTRLRVLEAVRESPRTRQELADLTDASRATTSRVRAELEDRGWIERTNPRYGATRRGARIAESFGRFLSNAAAAETLGDALGWLPTESFGFDLSRLGDAEVLAADYWEAPTRSIDRVAELARSADTVRLVGPGAAREVAASVRTLTVERDGTFEGVVEARAVEAIRGDEVLREHFRAILSSGRATVASRPESSHRVVVAVVDDTVLLCGSEDRDAAHDVVETDDERVRQWAETYVETAKAEAEPLDAAAFAP